MLACVDAEPNNSNGGFIGFSVDASSDNGNSCIGESACYYIIADIGASSCSGDFSCQYVWGTVGDASCVGTESCLFAFGLDTVVGSFSCINDELSGGACSQTIVDSIGDRSCASGDSSCANVSSAVLCKVLIVVGRCFGVIAIGRVAEMCGCRMIAASGEYWI